jgi:hypothetical protein
MKALSVYELYIIYLLLEISIVQQLQIYSFLIARNEWNREHHRFKTNISRNRST